MIEDQALAIPDPERYPVMSMSKEELSEVIRENIGVGGMSHLDLDRVRIPAGGGQAWAVPDLNGERSERVIRGIIAYQTVARGYWESLFEDGGGSPPTCYSNDGVHGIGDPGTDCATCKFNQWGSDRKGGQGKACRELRLLFMLQEGSYLPIVVALPPTSVKVAHQYFIRLASKGVPYYGVITEIGLEKTKSTGQISYSRAVFNAGAKLTQEQISRMRAYKDVLGPSLMKVAISREDVTVESESSEVEF